MNELYKIECYSSHAASVISNIISGNSGKCVVEGSAVVSDYVFGELEAELAMPFISTITSDLTQTDIREWIHAAQH